MATRHYLSKNDGTGKIYLDGKDAPEPFPIFDRGDLQGEVSTMMPGESESNPNKPVPGLVTVTNYGCAQATVRIGFGEFLSVATYASLEALMQTGDTVYYSEDDGANEYEMSIIPGSWRVTPLSGTAAGRRLEFDMLEVRKVTP